jgi:hypothetical protein
MAMRLNLLVEKPIKEEFEYIYEEQNRNAPAALFIKGPYMMAEDVNKNNRRYPKDELEREVRRYTEEMIKMQRAMGELNHPTSADVNLERACHLVTDIYADGNVYVGKSKVLSTPCGLVVKSLINDGVKVGMSSRALGTLEEGTKCNTVRNMRLIAVDCVADPSCPKAFVNGILESKQFVVVEDSKFEEMYFDFENSISTMPKKDVDKFLREQILKFISKL